MIVRRICLLVATLVTMVLVIPAGTASADPYCGITWGSADKTQAWTQQAELTNVRAGQQDCYDRLVIDFRGDVGGYFVSYVDEVTMDGSGNPVPLRGAGKLQVVVGGPAYDENGNLTYSFSNPAELVNVTGYQTFRQVAWAGSFEGQTTIGLGVRAHLPYRVFNLPNRIVVDVAHFW
jgi:hypothetical protein